MTQVFHPRFGLFVKLGLLGLIVILVGAVLAWRAATAEPHGIGDAVEQPVPFSHKHHVGDDGIDCRYCHDSVETSSFAGMPPLSTCMTCHSQLYTDAKALQPVIASWRSGVALHWKRVHQLPDFVYFNHGIHVAKGVGCASCHGRVDTMPLTWRTQPLSMRWCLDCHRAPHKQLRPIDTARLTDCSVCHR